MFLIYAFIFIFMHAPFFAFLCVYALQGEELKRKLESEVSQTENEMTVNVGEGHTADPPPTLS